MGVLIFLALVLCLMFGGGGIIIFIGIIILAIVLPNAQNSARSDLMQKNRDHFLATDSAHFQSTASVENTNLSDYAVYVDEANQKIMFANLITQERQIYHFHEIIECSILEDNAAIQSGGVGRAVAGSLIAGGVGAIVGASTRKTTSVIYSLSIRIVTTNIQHSLYEIPLITSETEKDTISFREKYQFAQEVYAVVNSVMTVAKQQQA